MNQLLGVHVIFLARGSLAATFVPSPIRTNGYGTLMFPTSSLTRCALFARVTDPEVPFMVDSGTCKVVDNSGGTVYLFGPNGGDSVQAYLPAKKAAPGLKLRSFVKDVFNSAVVKDN